MNRQELAERFKGRACKKLPKDSTKKEIKEVARIKRELKDQMRSNWIASGPKHMISNISKFHENYGETMSENFIRMFKKSS